MNTEKRFNTYEGRWKTNVVLNVESECVGVSFEADMACFLTKS